MENTKDQVEFIFVLGKRVASCIHCNRLRLFNNRIAHKKTCPTSINRNNKYNVSNR